MYLRACSLNLEGVNDIWFLHSHGDVFTFAQAMHMLQLHDAIYINCLSVHAPNTP